MVWQILLVRVVPLAFLWCNFSFIIIIADKVGVDLHRDEGIHEGFVLACAVNELVVFNQLCLNFSPPINKNKYFLSNTT